MVSCLRTLHANITTCHYLPQRGTTFLKSFSNEICKSMLRAACFIVFVKIKMFKIGYGSQDWVPPWRSLKHFDKIGWYCLGGKITRKVSFLPGYTGSFSVTGLLLSPSLNRGCDFRYFEGNAGIPCLLYWGLPQPFLLRKQESHTLWHQADSLALNLGLAQAGVTSHQRGEARRAPWGPFHHDWRFPHSQNRKHSGVSYPRSSIMLEVNQPEGSVSEAFSRW